MPYQNNSISKMVEPLKTGELLVKEGLIRPDDIHLALSIQEKRQASLSLNKSRLIGMILCDLNLITPMDNYWVLHKYNKLKSIQEALVSEKMLSREVVSNAKMDSQQQDIPFISLLLTTGLVSTTGMQSLLFDLFHIPFRSISDFTFNKKDSKELVRVLDKFKSRENRIIPLVLKGNTILFGLTEPENILFIRKLNDLFPQYRFKALFIPFSEFSKGVKILYESSGKIVPPKDKSLDLSLLLGFKVSIKNPEKENKSIQTLYERYELLRQLIGNKKRDGQHNKFNAFINQTYKKITREYKTREIEFSLKKENQDVKVIAFPKK
ncbi:MAG: hypothetical protein DRH34_05560 [Deltaproteobacteria bacterium]|nr:MAG: hypothetical protein DRH34_05560 [Deltaproteobacteria bacterium]RLC23529.1 MAG: hypothetical protein DRH93_07035 [Deltaproteobacteria bacterium]